ncbi:Signal recognition particle SEC65 subunit [Erysiphe necator]|uniref:Putative signal recognition particle protein sec65 n=1 Tax=Uncinula necator TaxID=52586 RepID=A0A0B1P7E4_UNCNE|nr:Signal recognition particle SEC65 subunit [Erysiphe necator]KHJ33250.1 putative signal recognition particle protein sec65 [Erysiphe necator]
MSKTRIEEVSESDPSEGDISDLSDDDFNERDILKTRRPPISQRPITESISNPSARFKTTEDSSKYSNFQCIYPIYFDKLRSRRQGRMVGKELAVENPMAREIVNACGRQGLETVFEPTKFHPKDWANPGRVRVNLRGGRNLSVKNKHHLYILISEHLKANPTTVTSVKNMIVPGVPPPNPSKDYPTPAIPQGWKINSILPYYSPALSDGGASEEMFKQMVSQMQSAGGSMPGGNVGGIPNMAALQGLMGGAATNNIGASRPQEKKKKKSLKKK